MSPRALIALLLVATMGSAVRAEPTKHWAFQSVTRPALPAVKDAAWPQNAVDYFVLAQQEARGLQPAAAAAKHQLLRRVTFDLTGLPPTDTELAAFLADGSPDAYRRVVERLLHSPRYGERMATHWLDLARYADTHGYYVDSHREMWRYRDEVIAAFNRHQPFDQFTVEQLAGDLLPHATLAQQIASGFNRNHLINFEPGAIPEEYLNEYVVDRTNTMATVWMGQTIGCAQCHDHKYDPFTMRDFYALSAFFNGIGDEGLDGRRGNAVPFIKAPTREQQERLSQFQQQHWKVAQALERRRTEVASEQQAWESRLRSGEDKLPESPRDYTAHFPLDEEEGEQTKFATAEARGHSREAQITGSPVWVPGKYQSCLLLDGETSVDAGDLGFLDTRDLFTLSLWLFPTTNDSMSVLSRARLDETERGYEVYLVDGQLHVALRHKAPDEVLIVRTLAKLRTSRWQHVAVTYDGAGEAAGVRIFFNGMRQSVNVVRDRLGGASIKSDQPLRIGKGTQESQFRGMIDELRIYARQLSEGEVELLAASNPIMELVRVPLATRTPAQMQQLRDFYLEHHDAEYQQLIRRRAQIERAERELLLASPTSMVMGEAKEPRKTFVLDRGDYRQPTEEVTANTPAALPPLPAELPRNRLALARWLVSGEHPLTARVTVNRLWQLHFGQGLVSTSEDFGTRGLPPSHPELLDWLADEFIRSGWDLQHIQRLIVTSATYQQQAVASHSAVPWLTGFPRQRLTAEMLRDQALAASGLLSDTMYGPGVFPYQPPGLWEEIGLAESEWSVQRYVGSTGADLYRRSLYTFWKRTSPAPNMILFDAPDRQVCTAKRETTNTPLQALVLWNDPTFVEAARQLASQALLAETSDSLRARFIFRRILGREPANNELNILQQLLARQRSRYRRDTAAAQQLLRVGASTHQTADDPAELAAWTLVAHAVLNLDEALSRN